MASTAIFFLLDTSGLREFWSLPAQWKSMVDVNMLIKDVKAYNRAGFVTNAQCIASYPRLLSIRRRPTTHITATPEALWTAEAKSLLAQCRLVESSVPEGVISVLARGDSDTPGRSSISVESAVRRMHTAWSCEGA